MFLSEYLDIYNFLVVLFPFQMSNLDKVWDFACVLCLMFPVFMQGLEMSGCSQFLNKLQISQGCQAIRTPWWHWLVEVHG